MKTHAQHAQHAPEQTAQPAPVAIAHRPATLDDMLDDAIIAERSALAAVARARAKVAEAERIAADERQILAWAETQARSAAETVRVLRQRCAAHAQALAALAPQQ